MYYYICFYHADQPSNRSQEGSDAQSEQTHKKPIQLLTVPKVIFLSLVFGILVRMYVQATGA